MSLMIKGINLPDEKLMEMFESDNHICIGGNYYPLMIKDVIQIPKDHGKIADITKYKKENAMQDDTCEGCPNEAKCIYYTYTKEDICEWLDDIPTILEAEE